jgi:hypothetical protein
MAAEDLDFGEEEDALGVVAEAESHGVIQRRGFSRVRWTNGLSQPVGRGVCSLYR